MNLINTNSSNHVNNGAKQRPVESVETAGSLAYNAPNILMIPQYDSFTSTNPFAYTVDYSNYATMNTAEAGSSGFLASFSNAIATIGGSDCGFSAGTCGGFAGGSCGASCSSGGFSSFV